MKKTVLFKGIKQLVTMSGGEKGPVTGAAMKNPGVIDNAAILSVGGKIAAFGPEKEVLKHELSAPAEHYQLDGVVLPGFCDSHTHPVFVGARLTDFSLRLAGATYSEIKQHGGGIGSSLSAVRATGEKELAALVAGRFARCIEYGTTSLEAKTGYGLDLESELKGLKAIKDACGQSGPDVAATLLAAHSIPAEFGGDAEKYVRHVIDVIIPAAAELKIAEFADVFCEKGYFSPEQTVRILRAALAHGMRPKVHGEQMCRFGGAKAAAEAGAVSVDHADFADASDIAELARAGVIATLLPASNYFLGMSKYPPARLMIDSGLAVSLATDFNPGTCPCWNMQFVVSCACTQMKMSPEEALFAATANGAWAMGRGGRKGVIAPGADADFAVFGVSDYREIAYYFGGNLCSSVVKDGRVIFQK